MTDTFLLLPKKTLAQTKVVGERRNTERVSVFLVVGIKNALLRGSVPLSRAKENEKSATSGIMKKKGGKKKVVFPRSLDTRVYESEETKSVTTGQLGAQADGRLAPAFVRVLAKDS